MRFVLIYSNSMHGTLGHCDICVFRTHAAMFYIYLFDDIDVQFQVVLLLISYNATP